MPMASTETNSQIDRATAPPTHTARFPAHRLDSPIRLR
jgi:hypothetical protein